LAIDLDGTLSCTDTLWESILGLLAAKPWMAVPMLLALPRGRAGFKRWLALRQKIDPTALVYNPHIVALAERARSKGRKTILVTGADQSIADTVAAYSGAFDVALGSDGTTNLTSSNKAAKLTALFGPNGFDYAGDSRADIAVWQAARHGYAVMPSARLLARARRVQPSMTVLGERPSAQTRRRLIARALRPHQWAKNALLFVPALAGHHLDAPHMLACSIGFCAFSLLASSVYVLNDLLDLPHDRAHPRKKHRPFASAALKLSLAPAIIAVCFGAGIGLSLLLPWQFLGLVLVYYVTTLTYSLRLKRLMVWDVVTLAGLYTLRIFAGAAAVTVTISPWLMAFSMFLFFSLAVVKRQTELLQSRERGAAKISGRGYTTEDLPMLMAMAAASGYIAVLVLVLYMNSVDVVTLYHHPSALWALCPLMMFWISRVLMLSHRGEMHDDPVVFALRDRVSLAVGMASVAVILLGMS
jgi:4-hydroxybenzoate polyprenyltransferase